LVTFRSEVKLIWPSSLSFATVLFYIIRYFSIVYNVTITIAPFVMWSEEACERFAPFYPIGGFIILVTCGILIALRPISVWGHDRRVIAYLTLILISIAVVVILTTAGGGHFVLPGFPGCYFTTFGMAKQIWLVNLFSIWFDSSVLALLLWRVGWQRNVAHSMGKVLFIDGIIYYLTLLGLNFLCLVFFLAYRESPTSPAGLNACLLSVMTAIMSNRVTLNLRQNQASAQQPINNVTDSTAPKCISLGTFEQATRASTMAIEIGSTHDVGAEKVDLESRDRTLFRQQSSSTVRHLG